MRWGDPSLRPLYAGHRGARTSAARVRKRRERHEAETAELDSIARDTQASARAATAQPGLRKRSP